MVAAATTQHGRERWRLWPMPSPAVDARRSAVLILLGQGDRGPDVLLTERSRGLRTHAGQIAFPGGAIDPADSGPIEAALREAHEEVGLDTSGVEVLGTLPDLHLPPSGFWVTPVLAWWRAPATVGVVDPIEVAQVRRIALAELVDPAHRVTVHHPAGHQGPGFEVGDWLVWGFTAAVLDRLLHLTGLERPWDTARRRDAAPATPVADAPRTDGVVLP